MIRTNAVQLTTIPAIAYRQKLPDGGSGITILRADVKQPGIASFSKTSGEPIPSATTNTKKYPPEAFKEALDLTRGMPYRKQKGITVTKDMIVQPVEEKEPEPEVIEILFDMDDYQKILDAYTDKEGNFSYALMNKDFIKFAKSSSIVRDMVAEGKSEAAIRNYVISNKFKNITGNDDLTAKQLKQMVEFLDELSPKSVYKEFNEEIRKMKSAQKKKK